MLPEDRMPEAEVTLRLAMALIASGKVVGNVRAAIDGAQVKTSETVHFQIVEFLSSFGWLNSNAHARWQAEYTNAEYSNSIIIHSSSGEGDLVADLSSGQRLRVESKKGPLIRSKSSQEYPLIREAIGQLITVEHAEPTDLLAVAVPKSDKFDALAKQWRQRPLVKKAGIYLVTVGRDNSISGLSDVGI